jgi:hypothetical protein
MSDLLTAGSKEDEIARTAKSREQAVRSIERVKSRTSPVPARLSKILNAGIGESREGCDMDLVKL